MTERSKAVVLLSGGLDSATALAEAKAAGFEAYALTVLYGQRHAVERDAARRVAKALGVARHVEQEVDLRAVRRERPGRRRRRAQGPRRPRRWPTGSRSPTSRRGTRSSSPWPWPGPRRWGRSTSSSASIAWTTRAIPTAGPSTSAAFETMANLATRAGVEGTGPVPDPRPAPDDDQGTDHRPGPASWASTTA